MFALMLAVCEVLANKCERVFKPGHWRVFRDDAGRVVIETWKP